MQQVREIGEDQIFVEIKTPPVIPGTKPLKSPFSADQNKAAGFALRMEYAMQELEALENAGFNPVNFYDFFVNNYIPFAPEALENFLSSSEYKQYARARQDFSTAQLRQETGAQISAQEVDQIYETYFPNFGDDQQTILNKKEARERAVDAMKQIAGEAYTQLKKGMVETGSGFEQEEALEVLIKRAENDPKLKQKLIEKGLIDG